MTDVVHDPAPQEIVHPGLRALYDYWDERRSGRNMPGRQDLDPLDVPALLPNLMLIDVAVAPFRMAYRVVGTALVERMGRDTTGMSVEEAYVGSDWEKILKDYLYVIEKRQPCLRQNRSTDAKGRHLISQRLLLPLSSAGKVVDMILAGTFWADEW